jgi:hypothetical protein
MRGRPLEPGDLNFEDDVRSESLKYLPFDRENRKLVADLEGSDTTSLLIRFLNWRDRLIHAHPRMVCISREMLGSAEHMEHQAAIDSICKKIALGEDLTPHLSERIRFGYLPRDPVKPRRDNPSLDLLLNEWGMHHLHISSEFSAGAFVTRSEDLLVCIFRDHCAYLIDIIRHGEWSDKKLVEIAYGNWPGERFFVPLKGCMPSSEESTSADRGSLRKSGMNSIIVVDGVPIVPAMGGITTAGTSTRASIAAFRIKRSLLAYQADPQKLVSDVVNSAQYRAVVWPEIAQFRFRHIITPEGYRAAIIELQTGAGITLTQ